MSVGGRGSAELPDSHNTGLALMCMTVVPQPDPQCAWLLVHKQQEHREQLGGVPLSFGLVSGAI